MAGFRDVLSGMITTLQQAGSKLTDFTPTSVIFQILSAVSSVVDQIYFSIDNAQKQAYITTASGEGLDNKGADLGVPRKPATAASWLFEFTKKQVSTQKTLIPKGTLITTIPQQGQAPIVFATDEETWLPSGSEKVRVMATCTQPGEIGNVTIHAPLLIGSTTVGIDGVKTPDDVMVGTFGLNEEGDEAYQKRLLQALASKAQGTVTWYEQTALSVPGVMFAKVVQGDPGSGAVFIYIVATGNSVGNPALLNAVQAAIDAGRILTDNAKVVYPTELPLDLTLNIQIAKGYDLTKTQGDVAAKVRDYINSLGIGGGELGALYMSQVNSIALSVPGVINILAPGTAQSDTKFSPYQLPQAGTITVTASYPSAATGS